MKAKRRRVTIPADIPTENWWLSEITDARRIGTGTLASCQLCETRIRWCHALNHPTGRTLVTGWCCAERVVYEYDGRAAEKDAQRRFKRLDTFTKPSGWKQSSRNAVNVWRWFTVPSGAKGRLTVFEQWGKWGVCWNDPPNQPVMPRNRFATRDAAMRFAFDLLEGM